MDGGTRAYPHNENIFGIQKKEVLILPPSNHGPWRYYANEKPLTKCLMFHLYKMSRLSKYMETKNNRSVVARD